MKISVICTGRGSNLRNMGNTEGIIHHVDFAVKKEKTPGNQKFFGNFHLESTEPFHYKENNEYSIDLSESITLVKPFDIKSGRMN